MDAAWMEVLRSAALKVLEAWQHVPDIQGGSQNHAHAAELPPPVSRGSPPSRR